MVKKSNLRRWALIMAFIGVAVTSVRAFDLLHDDPAYYLSNVVGEGGGGALLGMIAAGIRNLFVKSN